MTTETKDPRLTRSHMILNARAEQIRLNLLAVAGGRPYINARLSRLPYESDVSWGGSATRRPSEKRFSTAVGNGGAGRKDRAFLVNDAGRIANKINQFVLSNEVKRLNANPVFLADTTRTGTPINAFMSRVSEIITAARWCWISVDRDSQQKDAQGQPVVRSVAAKEASGDRVFWSVWNPNEVVDWHFDRNGILLWLITEQIVFQNEDVTKEPETKIVRTIWKQGAGVRLWLNKDRMIAKEEPFSTTLNEVGFIPVGNPSADAWWFDDVEAVQAAILNMESAHTENLFQTAFPQMIIPDGMLQNVMQQMKFTSDASMELIRGLNYPIIEPLEAAGLTRYLMPAAGDYNAIPTQITRLRAALREIVGLALQSPSDTRQVSSADAKSWDHLDSEQVLKERAQILEEAETKAVELSKRLDNTFASYQPSYEKNFDVRDLNTELDALLKINDTTLSKAAGKEIQRAIVEVLDRLTGLPADRKKAVMDAIMAE